ncbi:formate dehydrogenase accessory sulfurtransferase FdhD [Sphingomonas sp. BIUV-7]|uniref:Sulfur carrier protein FdhD n=1 Tax=Sphingomonas natans TaxID=3063330 RepID=A0ABT8YEB5_9SPHN|nr:formate dehydrogenase accessory sulfurtransferase FdhD [Sphingomonas sp. BIUV-7]MDO6416721.1 formate dehydrogenase accessory sulfurtransferase FdhD [Sphingomonas sp. BIUV-7]
MNTAPHDFLRAPPEGAAQRIERELAVEMPVAIEVNGLGYAVLMASPSDLDDLVHGFLLTERLIDGAQDIADVDIHEAEAGMVVRVAVAETSVARLAHRVRHRTADASCGLCGIENLEQALRPLPAVPRPWAGEDRAVFAALSALDAHQPLNRATGAVHAAARCAADGRIVDVREDVGRHNAFDKLIGAMVRAGQGWEGGFALLTSRCSYELVEKAVLSGCPMLATISAPTDLAVRRAADAGLALRVLARRDALLISLP